MKSYFTTVIIAFIGVLIFSVFISARQSSLIADRAELIVLAEEFSFTEGPAADKSGNVFFTDQPSNRILKWVPGSGIEVYMENAGRANGLYFDNYGNLLAAADERNQLWRINSDKETTVLVDDFKGDELNGPNDIWVDAKGGIYFTDPFYQREYWIRRKPDIDGERVYYLAPDGSLQIVADDVVKPNGIIGSPDGKKLYIADIGDHKTYSYTILANGSLRNQTLFAEMGSDGMTLDEKGNLYLTGNGVTVISPTGELIEHIAVPQEWTANVTFGGKNRNILFITAMSAVYTIDMKVRGAY
jgi:gluconolactonase